MTQDLAAVDRYAKRDVWLLWQTLADGRVYLLTIDESEELAGRHKRMIANDLRDRTQGTEGTTMEGLYAGARLFIEKRETNHAFGLQGGL